MARDCKGRIINELDVVQILVPVTAISIVEEKEVTFPANTEGTVIDIYGEDCVIEICWNTSEVSNDGILVENVESQQLKIVWRNGKTLS